MADAATPAAAEGAAAGSSLAVCPSPLAHPASEAELQRAFELLGRLQDCGVAPPGLADSELVGGCAPPPGGGLRAACASLAAALRAPPVRAALGAAGAALDAAADLVRAAASAPADGGVGGAADAAAAGGAPLPQPHPLDSALAALLAALDPGADAAAGRLLVLGAALRVWRPHLSPPALSHSLPSPLSRACSARRRAGGAAAGRAHPGRPPHGCGKSAGRPRLCARPGPGSGCARAAARRRAPRLRRAAPVPAGAVPAAATATAAAMRGRRAAP